MSAADDFRRELAGETFPGEEIASLSVRAMAACDCGCGLPPRVEVRIDMTEITLVDAVQVDMLIDMLIGGREVLWGPRPKGG